MNNITIQVGTELSGRYRVQRLLAHGGMASVYEALDIQLHRQVAIKVLASHLSGDQTFREKLAQHAQDPSCTSCHRKMDPLGFALDNFNAVGRWRDKQGEQPLDVSGELPSGEKLNGIADLKRVILSRKDDFVRNLSEQMLNYAIGRELEDTDDCPVRQIANQLKSNDYRFSTLVLEIVKSYPFQYRKNQLEK